MLSSFPLHSLTHAPTALMSTIGKDQLTSFYLEAHTMIRGITGIGAGHGPFISIHDGFMGVQSWAGFLTGSDRIILDTHPYFAFDQQPNDAPIATSDEPCPAAGGTWPNSACSAWGGSIHARCVWGTSVLGCMLTKLFCSRRRLVLRSRAS